MWHTLRFFAIYCCLSGLIFVRSHKLQFPVFSLQIVKKYGIIIVYSGADKKSTPTRSLRTAIRKLPIIRQMPQYLNDLVRMLLFVVLLYHIQYTLVKPFSLFCGGLRGLTFYFVERLCSLKIEYIDLIVFLHSSRCCHKSVR